MRESRDSFFVAIEPELRSNPKRFWSILKIKSKHRNIPETVSMATGLCEPAVVANPRNYTDTPDKIVYLFNRYFASVFIPLTDTILTNESSDRNTTGDPILSEVTFTTTEVLEILCNLYTIKATGPDEVPARILKETAHEIAPSLCELFNKSLRLGVFPADWKLANVVPVFKKGNKEHVENYRPISLLSTVSKVMERCLFNSIKYYVIGLISECQHGFIAGRSCVTQLVDVLDHIGAQLDNGGQVDTVYLDMSKAFDKVSHPKLLQRLRDLGFGGGLLNWFESQSRLQKVTALGVSSQTLQVTSGVPQGSILGPVLFLLYVNTLPDAVHSAEIATFVDVTKIYKTIRSPGNTQLLQKYLNSLNSWSTSADLIFNKTKCKAGKSIQSSLSTTCMEPHLPLPLTKKILGFTSQII